jgi:LPXTG-site transpeptidase (sortase) family protein
MNKLAKIFLGLGFFFSLLTLFFIYQRNVPISLANTQIITSETIPVEIIIPGLNIDLPIIPATLQKGKWELTSKGVSYLISSDSADISGSNILYGHNWPNLLGKITKLQIGDKILLRYTNQINREYIVTSIKIINSADISVLSNESLDQLTLYTCSGFLDSKRLVIKATVVY